MKKATIILLTVLLGTMQAKAYDVNLNRIYCNFIEEKDAQNVEPESPREISILDGTVILEMQNGGDFPCIGIQLSDKNTNRGLGTCLEIKKREGLYIIENKKYRDMDKGIEVYLRDLFLHFYDDKNYGKKVWSAFVKEGGLQQFLNISKEFIDDEFLNSPFNETYG